MWPVVVHLGCCHKISATGWLVNNRNPSSTPVEDRKSKIKAPADLVSGEGCLLTKAEKGSGHSVGSFIRALIPFTRALPSGSDYFSNVPPNNHHVRD